MHETHGHACRTTKVKRLPEELFMVMRVMTILRGVLAQLGVEMAASALWLRLAQQTLQRKTEGSAATAAALVATAADGGPACTPQSPRIPARPASRGFSS